MKKACVIGWPISHSRSPLIHNYWLSRYGIAGSYERVAVAPAELEKFFARIRSGEFAGCNITLPHKESAIAYIDRVDDEARTSGSVNTIYWEGADLVGTSTDAMGFADNLTATVKDFTWAGQKVLALGAGGSARAIIAGLLRREVTEVKVWNRTAERAETLSQQLGKEVSAVNGDALVDAAREADVNSRSHHRAGPWHAALSGRAGI
jgi:shikimate dehydrogenase